MDIPASETASGLPWIVRGDGRLAAAMAQQHGISELLAGILAGRGVALDDVPSFLNPSVRDHLPDPFHLLDMEKAASRIALAITQQQPTAVFGDYDVDGATSTALLAHYFAAVGHRIIPYIPDRMTEGYGPTVPAFETLIEGFGNSTPSPLRGGLGRGATEKRRHLTLAQEEQTQDRAQALRNIPTEVEKKLWATLRDEQLGVKFRRQHPIDSYIVDFVCLEQRLVIELDGGQHASQHHVDAKRTAYIQSQDFQVVRFWNHEVLENLEGVVATIVSQLTPPPIQPSPARGEGFLNSRRLHPASPLIITVDCGTLAHAPIAHAHAAGVDVIVLDHHLSSGALPNAHAVVNPNRVDENSAQTTLAAVGVTFLTLVAVNKKLREAGFFEGKEPNLLALLDMVALGTVCDVMPLTGLNRALVTQGLKVLAQRRNLGLAALADIARMDEQPNVYHLGFLLGPRINAGGRVGESGLGVELLTATDADHAAAVAARLDQYNQERQAIEASVLEAALAQAETQANMPVMLIAGEGWHAGVIGIVAGRVKEKYGRPVAVVALAEGVGKASARSVTGVDMGAAVHGALAEGLLEAGGGHAMAAGFTVAQDKLAALHAYFIARMEAAVVNYHESRVKSFDGWLSVASATLELLDDIARGGPYGIGNPAPRFGIRHARIVRVDVLKEKHLRCILSDGMTGGRLAAMAFNAEGTPLGEWLKTSQTLHLLGELKRNFWQGTESAQFLIADAAKSA